MVARGRERQDTVVAESLVGGSDGCVVSHLPAVNDHPGATVCRACAADPSDRVGDISGSLIGARSTLLFSGIPSEPVAESW